MATPDPAHNCVQQYCRISLQVSVGKLYSWCRKTLYFYLNNSFFSYNPLVFRAIVSGAHIAYDMSQITLTGEGNAAEIKIYFVRHQQPAVEMNNQRG
jgi:hypothetical protein